MGHPGATYPAHDRDARPVADCALGIAYARKSLQPVVNEFTDSTYTMVWFLLRHGLYFIRRVGALHSMAKAKVRSTRVAETVIL